MEWALGTTEEVPTKSELGHQGAGVQHAVNPIKQDGTGRGRPLAPCGQDVIRWATPWSKRTGALPICDECERITESHPDPMNA
jgi:hypothetical protein